MYIPKRWIAPGVLSLVLLVAILVTVLSSPRLQPAPAPVQAELAAASLPMQNPDNPACVPTAEQQAFNTFLTSLPPQPTFIPTATFPAPPIVGDGHVEAVGNHSPNSQFSAGSWGDIGQQWRDVQVNAPVTNVHISNEGANNTNNIIVGDNNQINSGPVTPPAPVEVTPTPVVAPVAPPTTAAPAPTTPPTTAKTVTPVSTPATTP